MIAFNTVFAQKEVSKKEIISITSTFKPSIIKTGKIDFFAKTPELDNIPFSFNYIPTHGYHQTTLPTFFVKPLAFKHEDIKYDSAGLFAKLGYGNNQNPLANIVFQSIKPARDLVIQADHISSKGILQDQQFTNSHILFDFKRRLKLNREFNFFTGYNLEEYRQYGFDHSTYTFDKKNILQQYKRVYAGSIYHFLIGENAKTVFSPSINLSMISTNKNSSEFSTDFSMPLKYQLNSSLYTEINPKINISYFKRSNDTSFTYSLFETPLNLHYIKNNFKINGGIIVANKKNKMVFVPDLDIKYKLGESDLWLSGGIKNKFSINSFHYLITENPFVIAPDSLSVSQKTSYTTGLNWINGKGTQFRINAGIVKFKDLPLFINSGTSGKDIKVVYEKSLTAINLNANFDYVVGANLIFKSSLEAFVFNSQVTYDKVYGMIPIQFELGLDWKVLNYLKLRFNSTLWEGATTLTNAGSDLRLKNAADLNLGFDIQLNKKWALWFDLNNIANMKYQRWSQYTSYGFNFVGGIRFCFLKM